MTVKTHVIEIVEATPQDRDRMIKKYEEKGYILYPGENDKSSEYRGSHLVYTQRMIKYN